MTLGLWCFFYIFGRKGLLVQKFTICYCLSPINSAILFLKIMFKTRDQGTIAKISQKSRPALILDADLTRVKLVFWAWIHSAVCWKMLKAFLEVEGKIFMRYCNFCRIADYSTILSDWYDDVIGKMWKRNSSNQFPDTVLTSYIWRSKSYWLIKCLFYN